MKKSSLENVGSDLILNIHVICSFYLNLLSINCQCFIILYFNDQTKSCSSFFYLAIITLRIDLLVKLLLLHKGSAEKEY